jgi:general secretion pathway protein D
MKIVALRACILSSALLAAACGLGVHDPMPPHLPHPEIPPGMTQVPQPPAPQAEPAWERILSQVRQTALLEAQQRRAQADEHYQLAESFHARGQFTEAELELEQALGLDPKHQGALALIDNVRVALGKGVVTPEQVRAQRLIDESRAQFQQTMVEIGDAYDTGIRSFNEGDTGAAETRFRTILEYVKWLPFNPALEEYRQKALEMLDRTRAAARDAEIAAEALRRQRVEALRREEEAQRALSDRSQIKLMFDQAMKYFEERRYDDALKTAERLLSLNPNLKTADEMRLAAQRLRHQQVGAEMLRSYVEEWKRTFEAMDMLSVPVPGSIAFTRDREAWERIQKRGPKSIADTGKTQGISEQDQGIVNALRTQFISQFDFPSGTLAELSDRLQQYTNLNFAITEGADPSTAVAAQGLTNVPVETVLNLALEAADLGWFVQDGVVMIVPRNAVRARTVMEVYDVQDITYALRDFPGVQVNLAQNQLGVTTLTNPGEETPGFTAETLAQLIQETLDPDGWNPEQGHSISPQQGLLIVRQTPEVQAAIAALLRDFRRSTGVLVNIEARFLTVEEKFLEQIGMDFRDIDRVPITFPSFPRQPTGIINADDVNPAFNIPLRFFDPDGTGSLTNTSAGIVGINTHGTVFGNTIRPYGMRVQNIMFADQLIQRFLQTIWGTAGGLSLQYLLVDDVSVAAILRMVEKTDRGHVLNAPRLTLFNGQRGNTLIANQLSYIRDFNVQVGGTIIVPDPEIAVINDAISLEVQPVVSSDRRFITLELKPTVAVLTPPPPAIATLQTVVGGTGQQAVGGGAGAVGGAGGVGGGAAGGTGLGRVLNIEAPSINVQQVQTTVVMPDKGTMIVGGLTTYYDTDAESSIPLWRNLPILGFLGSERFQGRQRRQLLIIVKAEIVIPSEHEEQAF